MFFCFGFRAEAQVSRGGTPYFSRNVSGVKTASWQLPVVEHKTLLEEDALQTKWGSPMRIGVMQPTNLDLLKEATVIREDGLTHYLLSVTSPGATSLSLHFSDFVLPAGARMFFYDASGRFVLGAFHSEDVMRDGTFYTQAIPGDKVYVEYTVPSSAAAGQVVIDQVCHGYKDILSTLPEELWQADGAKGPHGSAEQTCHPNVACPEGDGWRDEIRSTVAIEIHSSSNAYMCTGTLVNNTHQDRTPYVLSAFHCQDVGNVTGLVFYFLYETYDCDGTTGVSNKSMTGAATMAKKSMNNGSDFWLIRLNQEIPDEYQPYFAGWDRREVGSHTPGICIHHPGGDFKKLSIPQSVSGQDDDYRDFWEVMWLQVNNKGVTEPGSSGSGLFNGEHRLIGTLTGGLSDCDDLFGMDYYGRFDVSWNRGTDSSNSLRYWLDPAGTDAVTLDGMDDAASGIGSHDNLLAPSFEVYPNPAQDIINISTEDFVRADIVDMQGRIVISATRTPVRIQALSEGIYLIRLYTKEGMGVARMVKCR